MGMGHMANLVIHVPHDDVKKSVPVEWGELMDVLPKGWSLHNHIYLLSLDDFEDEGISENEFTLVTAALNRVQEAFYDKHGLNLYYDYHDSESEGDRYDEVNGAYFELAFHEMYQLTPKGKQMKESNENVGFAPFVTYG